MAATLHEVVQSVSPGNSTLKMDAQGSMLLYDVATADLEDAITEILGSAEPSGDGGISRTLPLAHPRFTWMYADSVTILGRGSPALENADPDLEAPSVAQYADYPTYRLQVNFQNRPYAVLPDSSILKLSDVYTDEDGSPVTFSYANEWIRFTEIDTNPITDIIESQFGNQHLYTGASASQDLAYPAKISQRIPKRLIRVRWYQVPYSYILSANSYLSRYTNFVNQSEFLGYPPGHLRFDHIKHRSYVAPFPELDTESWTNAYVIDKLCDIEMFFEEAPRNATVDPGLSNANWIPNGHNAQCHFHDRKFYYAHSRKRGDETNKAYWYPTYYSMDFKRLFSDPDAA